MNHFSRAIAAALLLVLASAPCQAIVAEAAGAPAASVPRTLSQGVLQQVSGSTLRIGGVDYAISPVSVLVHARSGARAGTAQLAVGMKVAFSIDQSSTQPRITELWIVN